MLALRQRGFTIIEVMVAMFVLAVASGAILLGLMLSLSQAKESRERVMAHILVGSTIDELKAHPYGSPAALAGWKMDGADMVRTETMETIVNGLASPVNYQLRISPAQADASGLDAVKVKLSWTEPKGPASLDFKVPMKRGWNRAVERGSRPTPNTKGWHNPKAPTIPSEPSYRRGSKDHTVNPKVPDAGTIVNSRTKKYQELYNKLTAATTKLQTDQGTVANDQAAVTKTQGKITRAKAQKKPDTAYIAELESQLLTQQAKLKKDQGTVTTDQENITGIKQKIKNLDK